MEVEIDIESVINTLEEAISLIEDKEYSDAKSMILDVIDYIRPDIN